MNDTGDALSAGCLCHVPLRVVKRNTELLLCDVCLGCDGEVIGDGGEDDDGADEDGGDKEYAKPALSNICFRGPHSRTASLPYSPRLYRVLSIV